MSKSILYDLLILVPRWPLHLIRLAAQALALPWINWNAAAVRDWNRR
jgi:hypothetical protein